MYVFITFLELTIFLLCIENETKIGLTRRSLHLEKRITVPCGIGSVPLSKLVTVQIVADDAALVVPTAPCTGT